MAEPQAVPRGPQAVSEEDDIAWMRLALAAAQAATTHGDVPVGAVVVGPDGDLWSSASNERELAQDPTAHAELVALRRAAERRGHWRLTGASLYVTLEPCAMCAGALVNARVRRLVYGAADPKAGASESLYCITTDARLNHQLVVRSGVLAEESIQFLQAFFRELRAFGQK